MKYTFKQLEVFLKISQTKSVSKAAKLLYLSQPAVSTQLKNFQAQFNLPLTELVKRKLYLTEFGQEVAKDCEKILEDVQSLDRKALAYQGQLTGRLSISVVSTGKYLMPYFLKDFTDQHPAIELSMDVSNKAKVLENITKNEVDFSLIAHPLQDNSLDSLYLLDNKLFMFISSQRSVPDKCSLEALVNRFPFIYREEGSSTRQFMEMFIEGKQFSPSKQLELTSNEAVKQAVIAGLGCSILPLIGLVHELDRRRVKIVALRGLPILSEWRLIWRKGREHSPVAAAFLDYLKTERARVVEEYFNHLGYV